ncbi:MAG: hypothetical protein ABI867_03415 [Kofleriaceae bacterium]
MRSVLALAVVVACSGKTERPSGGAGSAPPIVAATTKATCAPLAFAESTPVPEASGAAWMTIDDKLSLVVIADSGNDGAYGILDPETGTTGEQGELPLFDSESTDLEGAATRDGKLVVLTSAGWIREYTRTEHGFALAGEPYPLGPVDMKNHNARDDELAGSGMVCSGKKSNCGRNYEGLCLAPDPKGAHCVGFAAAKADGKLYCLFVRDGKLTVDHDQAIAITKPGALADCAYDYKSGERRTRSSAEGDAKSIDASSLYAGSNAFDLSRVYRIAGWQDPATAKVSIVDELGIGFPETLAVRGDIFYRMSDTGGAPSMLAKYRCTPAP